jgi:hypothetical protein
MVECIQRPQPFILLPPPISKKSRIRKAISIAELQTGLEQTSDAAIFLSHLPKSGAPPLF